MDLTLVGMDGIPIIDGIDNYDKSRILAMDQLGTSFENLCKRCANQFSLTTVLMIGDQMQGVIEWMHSCGVLHRDIKPQNFFVGHGQFRNTIDLIEVGMLAPYRDQRTHQHAIDTRKHAIDTPSHQTYKHKQALSRTNTQSTRTNTH
jgi:serine/threonine protein kinase